MSKSNQIPMSLVNGKGVKKFVPEQRRTNMTRVDTLLDDFFKPHFAKAERLEEVKRIEDKVLRLTDQEYYIVGYGSLMNKHSREKSFKTIEAFPARISGWKRVFNIASKGRKDRTVLNVVPDVDSKMSVVISKVKNGFGLINFLLREWQYDIIEVSVTSMNDNPLPLDCKVLMVVGREDRACGTKVPVLSYVQTCLNGCKEHSPEIVDEFLDNSYMSDETTTLREWMTNLNVLEYMDEYQL